jgi:hypothetical protein
MVSPAFPPAASIEAGPSEDGFVPEDEDLEVEEPEGELEEPEDLDEADLEDLDDEELIDEEVLDDDVELVDEADLVEGADDVAAVEVPVATVPDEDDDDDDDDEPEPDEIEATLDEILKERLVVADEEDDEEEEVPDTDDRVDVGKVLPKQPGEFVCQSCFLVKHPSQLADARRMWCRDCV